MKDGAARVDGVRNDIQIGTASRTAVKAIQWA